MSEDPVPAVRVTRLLSDGKPRTVRFTAGFVIGRGSSCDLRVDEDGVSKRHAEVYYAGGRWWIRDLGSSNGTWSHGRRVQHAPLSDVAELRLAGDGPVLRIDVEGAPAPAAEKREPPPPAEQARPAPRRPAPGPSAPETPKTPEPRPAQSARAEEPDSVTQIVNRYFSDSDSGEAGERTLMMRRAYQRVKKKQTRRYGTIISVVAVLLVAAVGVGVYQHLRLQKLRAVAVDIFYTMKTLQVQVEQIQSAMEKSGSTAPLADVKAKRAQLRNLEARYDEFLDQIGVFGKDLSPQDRLILKVARIFGECELNVPKGFSEEVKRYIGKWKSSNRLKRAMQRLKEYNYAPPIYRAMVAEDLPPQFLYLALQESDFKPDTVGPPTRFGIAKGIWQFIPSTAAEYGLETGPLVELPLPDPKDERFDFDKATQAAAHYLHDIYSTEAQASGLLVIAAYNWGHNRVRSLIRAMPQNPRQRNFWLLLKQRDIPRETHDYVFYIFSAAVIGEDPKLFGFDFRNPLAGIAPATASREGPDTPAPVENLRTGS